MKSTRISQVIGFVRSNTIPLILILSAVPLIGAPNPEPYLPEMMSSDPPPPPVDPCTVHELHMVYEHGSGNGTRANYDSGRNRLYEGMDWRLSLLTFPSQSTCITDFINNAMSWCIDTRNFSRNGFNGTYTHNEFDDCIAEEYLDQRFGISFDDGFTDRPFYTGDNQNGYRQFSFLFDNACNPLRGNDPAYGNLANACRDASMVYNSSPISLIWEEDPDFERDVTLARFSLDARFPERWYVWKASSKAPLLVFDPEHHGKITSAPQLFGEWALGGQRLAALNSRTGEYSAMARQVPWKNGYEALATFDRDADGRVSGRELAPLALWFDDNRNGISETGEVKTLSESGVTALFYTPDRTDTVTRSIHASIGYERLVDGKIQRGRSVDWYGDGADSKFELISKHMMTGGLPSADEAAPYAKNSKTEDSGEEAKKPSGKFSGVWKWTAVSADAPDAEGFLILSERPDGSVKGYSMMEVPFAPGVAAEKGVRSVLKSFGINGGPDRKAGGTGGIKFSVGGQGASQTESRAWMDYTGNRMSGVSTAHIKRGQEEMKYDYKWSAIRWQGR